MKALRVLTDIFTTPNQRIHIQSLPVGLSDIVQHVEIPRFSPADAKSIVNRLKFGEELAKVLNSVDYEFPYSETLLKEMLNVDTSDPDVLNNVAILGMYSFVTWMSYFGTRTQPNVQPLICALLHIIKKGQLVENMIRTAFETALQHLGDGEAFSLTKEFLEFANEVECEDIAVLMFQNMAKRMNEFSFRQFVVCVIKLMLDKNWHFADHEVGKILEALDPIYLLDPTVLKFLSLLNVSIEHLVFLSQAIPVAFFRKIERMECLSLPKSTEDPVTYPLVGALKAYMDFPDVETLPDGFSPNSSVTFPPLEDLSHYFPEEILADCQMLSEFLASPPEEIRKVGLGVVISGFFTFLEDIEDDPRFYCMFGLALVLTNKMLHSGMRYHLAVKVAKKFYHKRIFDPGITIFSEGVDFSLTNTFRALCLDGLLLDTGGAVNYILGTYITSMPLLLAETCYRLSNMKEVFMPKIREDPRLIKTLINVSLFYQHLEIDSVYDKQNIRIVRISLLSLFAHLFSEGDILELFFRDNLFCNSFLALLFEESVRPFVISALTSYLTLSDFMNNAELSSNLILIINTVDLLLPHERPLMLLGDLITCLSESFAYHQKGIAQFGDLCLALCQSMAKLSTNSLSKQVFEKVISFLAVMSPYFVITPLEISALSTALVAFDDLDFTVSLQNKFLVLLAGQTVGSLSPNFIIRQPQVLKLFIETLFDTPKLSDMLKFVIDLCKYSPRNLEACGKSDLDLFVMRYLEKAKQTETVPCEIVKLFLDLYSLLSLAHSSLQSVLRYISLMSPLDGVHVSRYQDLFIDNLNEIVLSSSHEPASMFALNGYKIHFSSDEIKFPTIADGFNITFWIHVEPHSSDYQPKICSIHIGNSMKIKLFLSNNSLFVFQDNGQVHSTSVLYEGFEYNVWHFVAMYIHFMESRTLVHYAVDGSVKGLTPIPALTREIVPAQVSFSIGGRIKSQVTEPSRLGAIGLFQKLTPDELISVFELGLRHNHRLPVSGVVYISDYALCAKENGCIFDSMGFVNVLVSQCGVTSLLPVFCQSDLKLPDESPYSISLESILVLLANILAFSQEAQFSFYQNTGFGIMSYLLWKYWTKLFTMKIYLQLFQMLVSFQCEPLQQQLFDEVMTDFTFLMFLDPVLHLRIVKHWSQSLFTSFSPIAQNFSSFEDLMVVLRVCYWYKPVEENLIRYKDIRSQALNVKQCRKYIFMILREYTREHFDETQYHCLISHAISCAEEPQVSEMLAFLYDIFSEDAGSIQVCVADDFFESMVVHFMKHGSDTTRNQVFNICAVAHAHNLISDDFMREQVIVCTLSLPHESLTNEIFQCVCGLLKSDPAFLPLSCYIALFLHEYDFLSRITSSHLYAVPEFWGIWPLALCMSSHDQHRSNIMKWMIACAKGNLCSLYAQIDVVLEIYPEFTEFLESAFIEAICKAVAYDQIVTKEFLNDFVFLCKRLICFTRKSERNRAFMDFQRWILKQKVVEEHPHFVPESFIQRVCSQEVVEPELEFGLSFDKEGNWVHQELAKLIVVLTQSLPERRTRTNYSFELLLCSFLLRKGVDVTHQLEEIHVPDSLEYEILMQAVNYSHNIFKRQRFYRQVAGANPFYDRHKFDVIRNVAKSPAFSKAFSEAIGNFRQFCCKIGEISSKLGRHEMEMYSVLSISQIQQFLDRQTFQNEVNAMAWERLWSALSIERGPWYNPTKGKAKWKRDISACFASVPVKLLPDTSSVDLDGEGKSLTKRGMLIGRECRVVNTKGRHHSEIELYPRHLTVIVNNRSFSIPYSSICCLFRRPNNGCHIFTVLGRSFHLEFESSTAVDEMIKEVDARSPHIQRLFPFQRHDPKTYFKIASILHDWETGSMSNYEYLLLLNSIAGRSFNDISNYPIFPWVLSDFESELDIHSLNPSLLRDFTDESSSSLPKSAVVNYLKAIEPFTSLSHSDSVPVSMQSFVATSQLVPEFYVMPEIFEISGFALPKWASSPLDFVYLHRKVLESEIISSRIHKWIQSAFGDSIGFDIEHPQRKAINNEPVLKCPFERDIPCLTVDAAIIKEEKSLVFHVWVYEKSGRVLDVEFDVNPCHTSVSLPDTLHTQFGPVVSKRRTSPKRPNNAKRMANKEETHSMQNLRPLATATKLRAFDGRIVAITPSGLVVLDIATGRTTEIDIGSSNVNDIETSGGWIVAGGDNATITLIQDCKNVTNIRLFRDAVTACAVSSVFNIAVGGTKDSALIFCSPLTSTLIKVVSLQPSDSTATECVARKILITPSWGFIVAYCREIGLGVMKHLLAVYTVNGLFVHKTEIPFSVDFWYSWKSNSGFDYIIYADKLGQVYFSEVYNLNEGGTLILNCRCRIAAALVSPDTHTLVVVTKSGLFTAIPLNVSKCIV